MFSCLDLICFCFLHSYLFSKAIPYDSCCMIMLRESSLACILEPYSFFGFLSLLKVYEFQEMNLTSLATNTFLYRGLLVFKTIR
uniref:Putative secreted protein n=1 Tax=Anopheles marajoara TaxID=58244 RepID=A0A2M4CB05_9DIPT